jgi:ketosteroid isomerase-like protein
MSLSAAFLLFAVLTGCSTTRVEALDENEIIREVRTADDARAACLQRGDRAGAAAFLSERYVYNDIAANRLSRQQMIDRRGEDHRRVIESVEVDSETVVISQDVVIQRGREDVLSVYYGGLPRRGGGRWMAVWHRERDGVWRVVAEQATEATQRTYPVKARIELPVARLAGFAGSYTLETDPPLTFLIRAGEQGLLASIPGEFEDMLFYPEGGSAFFSTERPFDLVFDETGGGITLTTWGVPTRGTHRP